MVVVAIGYSVLAMYTFNRSEVHQAKQAEALVMANRRLSSSCGVDFSSWDDGTQVFYNLTGVIAIILIIDQIRTMILDTCKKGNILYYFSHADNLYNLVATVVKTLQSYAIVAPNAMAYPLRILAASAKSMFPKDDGNEGDIDASTCDTYASEIYELFMFLVCALEAAMAMMVNLAQYHHCKSGPSLALSAIARPSPDLKDWDGQEQCLVNVELILSWFFIVNIVVEYGKYPFDAHGAKQYFMDGHAIHELIIAVQTMCLEFGAPIATSASRAVRPTLVWGGCAKRKVSQKYLKVERELNELRTKHLAAMEGEGPPMRGCCTRDPLSKWTC